MATVKFGTFSKKRNSTKQPTTELSDSRTVTLKEGTSQDRPIFKVGGNNFTYNYCEWEGRYYFIEDTESLINNEVAYHCILDPLATYKSEILAGTHFVAYSSASGGSWLPDTRIPVLKSTTASKNTANTGILSRIGCYVLSAIGKDRCVTYMIPGEGTLGALLSSFSDWTATDVNDLMDQLTFQGTDDAIESLTTLLTRTSLMGNAYEAAPACIRSCIWVPFDNSLAPASGSGNIWLGRYDTGINATIISGKPITGTATVSIPWHFSDWRRAYCEQVYIYLPLVGTVALSSDSLTNVTSITVDWSVTYSDGTIAYELKAGNEIIGSYGGQCSANYPLGVAQQASAGQVANTFISGVEHTVAESIDAGLEIIGSGIEVAAGAAKTAWDVANVALTSHPSCVGGIGGGAGSGIDLTIACYTVAHDTVIAPSAMAATMGLPTQKPMALSGLTGFCQCVNAHVDAPATAGELSAIDMYLNSGFFIE